MGEAAWDRLLRAHIVTLKSKNATLEAELTRLRTLVNKENTMDDMTAGLTKSRFQFSPPLDPGIASAVILLRAAGIETFESCEGGEGHSYAEPTIRFSGDRGEGFRAFSIAHQHGLPASDIRRVWPIIDGEPTGPYWELVFSRKLGDGPAQTLAQNHMPEHG